MRARTWWTAVVVTVLAVGAAGCGDDGDDDAAPEPPPDSGGLVVTSTAFADGDPVPQRHTCDGADVAPPLAFEGVPDATAELALVVRDPGADGFVHWVVAGLPPELTGLAEGDLPPEATEADNGFGEPGWAAPCPPEGDHTYAFTLYALEEPSGIGEGDAADEAAAAVESTPAAATATLRGTYERP